MEHIIYELTWNDEKKKYDKKPLALGGKILKGPRADMLARLATLGDGYCLGLWLRAEDHLWFLDLDECVTDGVMSPAAAAIAAPFIAAGCYFEGSSSGRGAHIIGRYTGELPPHANRNNPEHLEFYTRDRGVVLNLAANQGSMDVDVTALVASLVASKFPPLAALVVASGPRSDWVGPADDTELIRRACAATGSAQARMAGKATFARLWAGQVEHNSEADMALAAHLAFWTGCDAERMERLMWASGLARDKWREHRTYLRELTINRACASTQSVYREAVPTADWHNLVDDAIRTIANSGTYRELVDDIVPKIAALGAPRIHAERIVHALGKRLELFDAKLPIAQLRLLVSPPADPSLTTEGRPEWIEPVCYIKRTDKFFHVLSGSEYSHEAFRMEFNRLMPLRPNGQREDVVQWARDRWGISTVDDAEYRPDMDVYFSYAGKNMVNKFLPTTLPALAVPSDECLRQIENFQRHLFDICGHRENVYKFLLSWIAHNVQKPGVKIRWAPLVKGVQGDGKSIIGDLLFATMGEANVKMTSPATLANSGGFTDWATGAAVNIIEEIRLEGRDKRRLYNAMKIMIGDSRIDLNRKGVASGGVRANITNHMAFSNYGDAAPVEDGERRWCVIFTPYGTISEAMQTKGVTTPEQFVAHFKGMGRSMRAEPGAWRAWLFGFDLSDFDPDARAPHTPERDAMHNMANDSFDTIVIDTIANGAPGVCEDVFSSSCLTATVQLATGERPHDRGWNALLVRLGYQQIVKPVWWNGKTHRIWVKRPIEADKIREILDKTLSVRYV